MSSVKDKVKVAKKYAKVADVKDFMNTKNDVDKKRSVSISTAVLVSPDASVDILDAIHSAFDTAEGAATVKPLSFSKGNVPVVDSTTTLAVIISGDNEAACECLFKAIKSGVRAVVLTHELSLKSNELINKIDGVDEDDIIYVSDPSKSAYLLGRWIAEELDEYSQAYAANYSFVRRPLAENIIRTTAIENTVAGALIIIPGADFPLMTANQVKMVIQIAGAYGKPLNAHRIQEAMYIVLQGLACRGIARAIVARIPVVTVFAKAGMALAGTEAAGKLAIEYFERGLADDVDKVVDDVLDSIKTKFEVVEEANEQEDAATEAE